MKQVVETGSDVMKYIPSFIQIGSGIQKLMKELHRHTDRKKMTLAYFRKVG
jgi:hypothetical protein